MLTGLLYIPQVCVRETFAYRFRAARCVGKYVETQQKVGPKMAKVTAEMSGV